MSRGDRGAFFAIGLVSGLALALFFFVWAYPWFGDPLQVADYICGPGSECAQQYETQGDPHYWIRPFYGWLFAEDSLAQWLMAVFAAVATAVSAWAVMLLRDTLVATQNAVEKAQEANTIMQADQRPWVTFSRHLPCELYLFDNRGACEWVHERTNVGRQPAFDLFLHQRLVRYENVFDLFADFQAFVEHCKSRRWKGATLLPGAEPEQPIWSHCGDTFSKPGDNYALMAGVSYRHSGTEIGVDVRLFHIERDRRFPIGPRAYVLIEYPHVRAVE